jgi:hypothetical protein
MGGNSSACQKAADYRRAVSTLRPIYVAMFYGSRPEIDIEVRRVKIADLASKYWQIRRIRPWHDITDLRQDDEVKLIEIAIEVRWLQQLMGQPANTEDIISYSLRLSHLLDEYILVLGRMIERRKSCEWPDWLRVPVIASHQLNTPQCIPSTENKLAGSERGAELDVMGV